MLFPDFDDSNTLPCLICAVSVEFGEDGMPDAMKGKLPVSDMASC